MTRILLDTYTLIGVASEPGRLSAAARALLEDGGNPLFVSAISMWEVGVAVQKDRLRLSHGSPREWFARAMAAHGIQSVDVSLEVAAVATEWPQIHADPADRIIIATAVVNDLVLVTPDATIGKYPGVKVAW